MRDLTPKKRWMLAMNIFIRNSNACLPKFRGKITEISEQLVLRTLFKFKSRLYLLLVLKAKIFRHWWVIVKKEKWISFELVRMEPVCNRYLLKSSDVPLSYKNCISKCYSTIILVKIPLHEEKVWNCVNILRRIKYLFFKTRWPKVNKRTKKFKTSRIK